MIRSAGRPATAGPDTAPPRAAATPGATPDPTPRGVVRRAWLVGAAVLVVFNLLHAFPRYATGDPHQARIPLDQGFPEHYGVLVAHVVLGNLSMVTVFLQLLPGVRRFHPRVHRISGRLYVFAAALPGALLALVLLPFSKAPSGQVGLATMAVLWIATTVAGYVRARQRRFHDHRRWMVYSFALALGTSWGRVLSEAMTYIPGFRIGVLPLLEISSWLGWIVNLLIAHWWLRRSAPPPALP